MGKIIESATWTSLEKKTGTSILLSKTESRSYGRNNFIKSLTFDVGKDRLLLNYDLTQTIIVQPGTGPGFVNNDLSKVVRVYVKML
jgi:hypothetical protein